MCLSGVVARLNQKKKAQGSWGYIYADRCRWSKAEQCSDLNSATPLLLICQKEKEGSIITILQPWSCDMAIQNIGKPLFFTITMHHAVECLIGDETHLVCVVKAVIHKPCDQRRLPNWRGAGEETHKSHRDAIKIMDPVTTNNTRVFIQTQDGHSLGHSRPRWMWQQRSRDTKKLLQIAIWWWRGT